MQGLRFAAEGPELKFPRCIDQCGKTFAALRQLASSLRFFALALLPDCHAAGLVLLSKMLERNAAAILLMVPQFASRQVNAKQ